MALLPFGIRAECKKARIAAGFFVSTLSDRREPAIILLHHAVHATHAAHTTHAAWHAAS